MIFTISAIIPHLIGLFLFGVIYAYAVYKWAAVLEDVGLTWLLVVIGVSVTIGSLHQVIGLHNTLYLLFAFIATGAPMITGCIIKAIQIYHKNKRDQKLLLQRLATGGIAMASEVNDETPSVG